MVVTQDDLVERRRKYIQRQIELDKSAVNVAFAGRKPEGSGPRNRHGMPQLPTGQHGAHGREGRHGRGQHRPCVSCAPHVAPASSVPWSLRRSRDQ